jgi:hypothetical protein
MCEGRSRHLERRERQDEDPLRRGRAHRDPRAPEPAVEQELDDQAAERVSDQDGRLVECLDQRLVVVDDLVQPEALELLGRLALLLDAPCLRGHSGAETAKPRSPK